MSELQKSGSPWWSNLGDLSASRWANEPAPQSAVEGDRTFRNGTTFNHEHPVRRVRKYSITDLGLSRGLEASRWANPNIPAPPMSKEMGHIHPHWSARFNRVNGPTNGNANGLPHLTLNTQLPAMTSELRPDDGADVLMGENTPIETRNPAFVSAVLKDNDGDIVMQDLDDPSVTSRIVEVVEGTRTGVFQAQPEDTPQDLSYRVESVVEWVLVVDTNFILSHLYLVNNLVEAYHRWGNVVMIPWATIMELDGLKKSTSSIDSGTGVTVGMLARRANNWCFEKMAKREPGLWGQTKEEVLDSTAIKGDAAILDCCRYIKESKGINTAILSNDRNLCVQALVYQIKAVSFTGTPFTADGIMSYLESELQGGHSYRHPGIWLSVTEAKDQETKPMDTPYYAKAPAADSYKMGLYASRHAGPDVHYGRFGRDGHPPTDNPRERFSQNNPTTTLENIFIKPESDEEARASLGLLLLRIEGDLVAHFIPLLAHFWCTKVTIEGVPDPRAAIGIEGVETAVWVCLKSNFHQVFHHEGDINFKLKTNEYSRRWHAWGHWSGQDSTLAEKPTTKDLKDFSDEWARIWEGFLQFSDNYARDFKVYMMAVGVWKALISSLIPHLSQLTSA